MRQEKKVKKTSECPNTSQERRELIRCYLFTNKEIGMKMSRFIERSFWRLFHKSTIATNGLISDSDGLYSWEILSPLIEATHCHFVSNF